MLTISNVQEKVAITPSGLRFNSDLTFEEWSELAPQIGDALKSMAFVIGDWLVYGEEKFAAQPFLPSMEPDPRHVRISPERYVAAQVATRLDMATLKNYAYVSRRVPMSLRNDFLSWEHHKVVAKLATDKQTEWLTTAAASGDASERISVRRLRASITSGRVLSPEELSVPPSEQGVTNHIPSINRLCGWWKQIGGTDWIKTRSREQVAALLRDFEPVLSIINQLHTSIK